MYLIEGTEDDAFDMHMPHAECLIDPSTGQCLECEGSELPA